MLLEPNYFTTSHIVPIFISDAFGMQLGQVPEAPFDEQPLHPEQEGLFIFTLRMMPMCSMYSSLRSTSGTVVFNSSDS